MAEDLHKFITAQANAIGSNASSSIIRSFQRPTLRLQKREHVWLIQKGSAAPRQHQCCCDG